jgi:hypothetical protein
MVFKGYINKGVKKLDGPRNKGFFGKKITGVSDERGSGEMETGDEVKLPSVKRGK